jgi:hypothetical protein
MAKPRPGDSVFSITIHSCVAQPIIPVTFPRKNFLGKKRNIFCQGDGKKSQRDSDGIYFMPQE